MRTRSVLSGLAASLALSTAAAAAIVSATFTVGSTTFNLPAPDAFGAAARDGLQFLHNTLGQYSYTFNFISPDAPALLDTPFSAAGNPNSYGSVYLYTAN